MAANVLLTRIRCPHPTLQAWGLATAECSDFSKPK
jgi:hypothetical protein